MEYPWAVGTSRCFQLVFVRVGVFCEIYVQGSLLWGQVRVVVPIFVVCERVENAGRTLRRREVDVDDAFTYCQEVLFEREGIDSRLRFIVDQFIDYVCASSGSVCK